MSTQVKVALIGAAALIVSGLVTAILAKDPPPPKPTDKGRSQKSPVTVTIYDRLMQYQSREAINVEIDGKSEGDLVIDSTRRPEASTTASLVPGPHNYEIPGETVNLGQDGQYHTYSITGEGTIDVDEGEAQSFELQKNFSGNTLVASLEPR